MGTIRPVNRMSQNGHSKMSETRDELAPRRAEIVDGRDGSDQDIFRNSRLPYFISGPSD
jgi:hypothetical protein